MAFVASLLSIGKQASDSPTLWTSYLLLDQRWLLIRDTSLEQEGQSEAHGINTLHPVPEKPHFLPRQEGRASESFYFPSVTPREVAE